MVGALNQQLVILADILFRSMFHELEKWKRATMAELLDTRWITLN